MATAFGYFSIGVVAMLHLSKIKTVKIPYTPQRKSKDADTYFIKNKRTNFVLCSVCTTFA